MSPYYRSIAERANHRCEYCHAPEAIFNFPFEVEHIVPPSLGGTEVEDNLALACRACNVHKSDHRKGRDPQSRKLVRLFNPRRDRWPDHFQLNQASGEIVGTTEMGRATVASLAMNAAPQCQARQRWIEIGLFP
jgi:hypothetical protein